METRRNNGNALAPENIDRLTSWAFNLIDLDGSGFITTKEFHSAIAKFNIGLSAVGLGSRRVCTWFLATVLIFCCCRCTAQEDVADLMRLLDTNCDGTISLGEFCTFLKDSAKFYVSNVDVVSASSRQQREMEERKKSGSGQRSQIVRSIASVRSVASAGVNRLTGSVDGARTKTIPRDDDEEVQMETSFEMKRGQLQETCNHMGAIGEGL